MPRILQRHAVAFFALAVAFYVFFETCKHDPVLAKVSPFTEDPYDAVGSFGFQFVFFLALLSLVRAFRPYPVGFALGGQAGFLARGLMMGMLGVALTCIADGVAMARHYDMWRSSPDRYKLLGLVAGFFFCAIAAGALVFTTFRFRRMTYVKRIYSAAVFICAVCILCWYPERLRQDLFGEIFTVSIGAIVLFAPIAAFASMVIPDTAQPPLDLRNDLTAAYVAFKSKTPFLRPAFVLLDSGFSSGLGRKVWRNSGWGMVTLVGLSIGIFLAIGELAGSGRTPMRKLLLVSAVYIGLETFAITLGYALVSRPLALFRSSDDGRDVSKSHSSSGS